MSELWYLAWVGGGLLAAAQRVYAAHPYARWIYAWTFLRMYIGVCGAFVVYFLPLAFSLNIDTPTYSEVVGIAGLLFALLYPISLLLILLYYGNSLPFEFSRKRADRMPILLLLLGTFLASVVVGLYAWLARMPGPLLDVASFLEFMRVIGIAGFIFTAFFVVRVFGAVGKKAGLRVHVGQITALEFLYVQGASLAFCLVWIIALFDGSFGDEGTAEASGVILALLALCITYFYFRIYTPRGYSMAVIDLWNTQSVSSAEKEHRVLSTTLSCILFICTTFSPHIWTALLGGWILVSGYLNLLERMLTPVQHTDTRNHPYPSHAWAVVSVSALAAALTYLYVMTDVGILYPVGVGLLVLNVLGYGTRSEVGVKA